MPTKELIDTTCLIPKCELDGVGYDIERVHDEEGNPCFVVYYQCPEGHKFALEVDREEPA